MWTKWIALASETALLGIEAQQVIALRLWKLATGGKSSRREAGKMVAEKVVAAIEADRIVRKGGGARPVVRHYRRKVRANRRRLLR